MLQGLSSAAAVRRGQANLYHSCLEKILAPLASYGETGIAMASGDGIWRRCHPIVAVFAGDYPKQLLITGTFKGQCPKCLVPSNQLGEYHNFPLRDNKLAKNLYRGADGDFRVFQAACRHAGLKPIYHPFWESLTLTNIFVSITPDILHQGLQGIVKHVVMWITMAFGPRHIDTRCRSLPPNHHIKTFANGISHLSRISGQEHKDMCQILLSLVLDLRLPGGHSTLRLIGCVRALLNFLYLTQLPSHTTDTISCMNESLSQFHENKSIFVDLGICNDFNLPKVAL